MTNTIWLQADWQDARHQRDAYQERIQWQDQQQQQWLRGQREQLAAWSQYPHLQSQQHPFMRHPPGQQRENAMAIGQDVVAASEAVRHSYMRRASMDDSRG
jgi:hypothetical protein